MLCVAAVSERCSTPPLIFERLGYQHLTSVSAVPKSHPKAPVKNAKPKSVGKTTLRRSPRNDPEIPAPTAPEMNQFDKKVRAGNADRDLLEGRLSA
jgi:hypothetical protein